MNINCLLSSIILMINKKRFLAISIKYFLFSLILIQKIINKTLYFMYSILYITHLVKIYKYNKINIYKKKGS